MAVLKPVIGRLTYKVEMRPLRPGEAVERDGYRIHPFATDHHVPSVGYAIVEDERPGRFDIDDGPRARRSRGTAVRAAPAWRGRDARKR